jgi:hypothetical protein
VARKTFNDQLAILYQDAVDNRRFLKQQQWNVTNYAALVYAAVLYLYGQGWLSDTFISVGIPLVACMANVGVLWQLQASMTKFRDRIQWMYQNHFTSAQRNELKLKPSDLKQDRSIAVLLSLFSFLGAMLTLLVVLTERAPAPG